MAYEDEFDHADYQAARNYLDEHPEFALCRVRHDVSLHKPPVDIKFEADGTYTHIYVCGGCLSEYHRRYFPDGRYHSGKWVYAEGYGAKKGVGYALISRSGKAAFNLALKEIMEGKVRARKTTRRKTTARRGNL